MPETVMLNANTDPAKKSAEKKKYSQVMNVLKKSIRALTITK